MNNRNRFNQNTWDRNFNFMWRTISTVVVIGFVVAVGWNGFLMYTVATKGPELIDAATKFLNTASQPADYR